MSNMLVRASVVMAHNVVRCCLHRVMAVHCLSPGHFCQLATGHNRTLVTSTKLVRYLKTRIGERLASERLTTIGVVGWGQQTRRATKWLDELLPVGLGIGFKLFR